jgi:hypothetical protein
LAKSVSINESTFGPQKRSCAGVVLRSQIDQTVARVISRKLTVAAEPVEFAVSATAVPSLPRSRTMA